MAYFAQLDENNLVIDVIAISNEAINYLPFPESEPIGVALCKSLYGEETIWKQTSYNNNFRGHFAGVGYTYEPYVDEFVGPQIPVPPIPPEDLTEGVTRVGD